MFLEAESADCTLLCVRDADLVLQRRSLHRACDRSVFGRRRAHAALLPAARGVALAVDGWRADRDGGADALGFGAAGGSTLRSLRIGRHHSTAWHDAEARHRARHVWRADCGCRGGQFRLRPFPLWRGAWRSLQGRPFWVFDAAAKGLVRPVAEPRGGALRLHANPAHERHRVALVVSAIASGSSPNRFPLSTLVRLLRALLGLGGWRDLGTAAPCAVAPIVTSADCVPAKKKVG